MLRLLALILLIPSVGITLEKEAEIEIRRLDQRLNRVQGDQTTVQKDIRTLQRQMSDIQKMLEDIQKRLVRSEDRVIELDNVDINNLKAGQKKMYEMVPALNWGTESRDCQGMGKHQQIKNVKSKDGTHTLRYLCLDGRTLHLGTEVHEPPLEP